MRNIVNIKSHTSKASGLRSGFWVRGSAAHRTRTPGAGCRTPGVQSSVFRLASDSGGFTLIELLVAMAILMVIVLMLSNLFQQSTQAWSTGLHQTALGLEARSVINLIQRDASMALPNPPPAAVGNSLAFSILNREGEVESITYSHSGGAITRNGRGLVDNVAGFSVDLYEAGTVAGEPFYDLVEVTLELSGQTRVAGVRAYATDRNWEVPDIPLTDVVDTERGP